MSGEPMSHDAIEIKQAPLADADEISAVVLRCLRETNARYYAPDVLASIAENFSVAKIAARMADRTVLVATIDNAVVGTASLQGTWVRSVFVSPDRQGTGVGARLMQAIEELAGARDIEQITVPSSINAEGFYRRLGFAHLRDEFHGQERVILMVKSLVSAAGQS
jgi:GNAT superfamily N-acetyltransferase